LGRGFGHDTITDFDFDNSLDQVHFLDLEAAGLLSLQRLQNNLIFSFASGDQLTLDRFFETYWVPSWSGTPYAIESFVFADHSSWGWQEINEKIDSHQGQSQPMAVNSVQTNQGIQGQDEWDPITGFPSSSAKNKGPGEINSAMATLRDRTWNQQQSLESQWGLPIHGMQVWEEFAQSSELMGTKIHWEGISAATSTLGKLGPI
jgi:Haemolysin-type calcium binding protein related domain